MPIAQETAIPVSIFKSGDGNSDILQGLSAIVEKNYPVHPFVNNVALKNIESLLGQYLAMSQAFPYLQSGAAKEFIFHAMENNVDMAKNIEKSFVVGSFLSWDETGGHDLVHQNGMKALPDILETERNFHANLLKMDMISLLGDKEPQPLYSPGTVSYLKALYSRLSSFDPIIRISAMVAFEMHAGQMIESLWASLTFLFPKIDRESLGYFKRHVGGDDPAEVYHIKLTKSLIGGTIYPSQYDEFVREFKAAYKLNIDWCLSICL